MGRKPKVTKSSIETAYKLAKSGINDKSIMQALDISHDTFYKYPELTDTIKKARYELKESVANSLLQNATGGDTTSLIFLAKRLNLFSNETNIKLDSPKGALKALEDLANADISLEHKNSLRGIVNDYLKAYEITELEERITKLEEYKQ